MLICFEQISLVHHCFPASSVAIVRNTFVYLRNVKFHYFSVLFQLLRWFYWDWSRRFMICPIIEICQLKQKFSCLLLAVLLLRNTDDRLFFAENVVHILFSFVLLYRKRILFFLRVRSWNVSQSFWCRWNCNLSDSLLRHHGLNRLFTLQPFLKSWVLRIPGRRHGTSNQSATLVTIKLRGSFLFPLIALLVTGWVWISDDRLREAEARILRNFRQRFHFSAAVLEFLEPGRATFLNDVRFRALFDLRLRPLVSFGAGLLDPHWLLLKQALRLLGLLFVIVALAKELWLSLVNV